MDINNMDPKHREELCRFFRQLDSIMRRVDEDWKAYQKKQWEEKERVAQSKANCDAS